MYKYYLKVIFFYYLTLFSIIVSAVKSDICFLTVKSIIISLLADHVLSKQ